jgi:hypothetical protein
MLDDETTGGDTPPLQEEVERELLTRYDGTQQQPPRPEGAVRQTTFSNRILQPMKLLVNTSRRTHHENSPCQVSDTPRLFAD